MHATRLAFALLLILEGSVAEKRFLAMDFPEDKLFWGRGLADESMSISMSMSVPTKPPVKPPTKAPVTPPTQAPVTTPTQAPVTTPTQAPVTTPTQAPVTTPTLATEKCVLAVSSLRQLPHSMYQNTHIIIHFPRSNSGAQSVKALIATPLSQPPTDACKQLSMILPLKTLALSHSISRLRKVK
jgi:hypothetical protein